MNDERASVAITEWGQDEAERSVAATIMWEPVVGDLTGTQFRELVTRIADRLTAQGWTPPETVENGS